MESRYTRVKLSRNAVRALLCEPERAVIEGRKGRGGNGGSVPGLPALLFSQFNLCRYIYSDSDVNEKLQCL
jgi:hypothetical protein